MGSYRLLQATRECCFSLPFILFAPEYGGSFRHMECVVIGNKKLQYNNYYKNTPYCCDTQGI